MYADDIVLVSKLKQELQEAFNDLHDWSQENNFTINKNKTVSMVFRKEGKLVETDFTCCNDERLTNVNSFRYLDVILQTTGKSFKQHVKERASAALRAMHDTENLRLLSLETAMKLFSAKITLILTYGLEQIWDHLTVNDLTTLENVKVMYLKRALCLSGFTVSRPAYTMAREPFLVQELRNKLLLPSTDAFKTLLDKR
jgi:hypothetical protein